MPICNATGPAAGKGCAAGASAGRRPMGQLQVAQLLSQLLAATT
jgi:hypothetical protein